MLLLSLTIVPASSFAEDVVVIANRSIHEDSMSKGDIEKIFLGKKKYIDNVQLKIVMQRDKEMQSLFLQKFSNKSPSQFDIYYKRLIFSGKGEAPRVVMNNREMLSFVSNTPGAIGYVSSSVAISGDVKTINIQ